MEEETVPIEPLKTPRPVIMLTGRKREDIVQDALATLVAANDPPRIFTRGGELVRVSVNKQTGEHFIEPLTPEIMQEELARAAIFVKYPSEEEMR